MDNRVYIKEIDAELRQCDCLLAHAVERRHELSCMIISSDREYLRSKFIERLNGEITEYNRRADLLTAERDGLQNGYGGTELCR